MGIEVGKKPPLAGPVAPTATPSAQPPEQSYQEVAGETAAPPTSPVDAKPEAFELLRAGRIGLEEYVDRKVDDATAHLSALPPAKLEAIRAALRDRLEHDPTLVDLAATAARAVPPTAHDD